MVTLIKYGALGGGEKYNINQMWIDGLSTDAKPTATIDGMPIPNGSVFTEVDTGKTYMFDKDNSTWYEVSLGGGGGGGGGFTPTQAQLAAMNSGINSTKVAQIETNENNILTLKGTTDIVDTTYISESTINEYTENAYIDRRNGRVVTNAPNAFNCTDYYVIPTICNRILIKTRLVDDAGLALYDDNKTFIGRYNPKLLKSDTIVNTYEVMPPTNAKYIRSSLYAGSSTIANVRNSFRIGFYYDMRILNDKDEEIVGDITTLNECLPLLSKYWSYAMDKIICIGDSLTQGCYYGNTWTDKPYDGVPIVENYPYMLGRMLRCDVENAGFGGYSASDWWTNKQNTFDFTNYNTAIIWLGTNGGLTDTLDTDCVGDDYTTYANTNTGNYCKIIGKIKQTNPWCKIIIIKIFAAATSGMVTETNRTIGKIATRYGVTMLDNSGLGVTPHPELHDANNIHFSKSGNIYVANKLIMDMGKYFNENPLNCEFGFNAT